MSYCFRPCTALLCTATYMHNSIRTLQYALTPYPYHILSPKYMCCPAKPPYPKACAQRPPCTSDVRPSVHRDMCSSVCLHTPTRRCFSCPRSLPCVAATTPSGLVTVHVAWRETNLAFYYARCSRNAVWRPTVQTYHSLEGLQCVHSAHGTPT